MEGNTMNVQFKLQDMKINLQMGVLLGLASFGTMDEKYVNPPKLEENNLSMNCILNKPQKDNMIE